MKSKFFIICYDISDKKRLYRVRKVAYSFAFGGQKSAVETYLTPKEIDLLIKKILLKINIKQDKVNIIEVENRAILLGRAKQLPFEKGTIVI